MLAARERLMTTMPGKVASSPASETPFTPNGLVQPSAIRQGEPIPWLLLGVITLVALVLRLIGLNKGLWWDEIFFLIGTLRHPLGEILTVFTGDTQHPLYSVLARLCLVLFGEEPWSLRLPAVLFGVASVPALYLLAAKVTSRAEAMVAAAFLAVSYHHIWFSQNARGYTALAFFAIVSALFLLDGIRSEKVGPFIAYAVAASLGIYTHITMVFLVAAHFLVCAGWLITEARRGKRPVRWQSVLAGFVLTGVLAALMYAPILTQVLHFFAHHPSSMKAVSTPKWALAETLRGLSLGLGTTGVLLGAAVLVLSGMWSYWKESRLVFSLFVVPVIVTAMGAFAGRGTMYPRFYFFLIGYGVLILVRGIFYLPRVVAGRWPGEAKGSTKLSGALAGVLAGILLLASAYSLRKNYQYPKQDFDGALKFIESEKKDDGPVLTAGATVFPYQQYFGKPWQEVKTPAELEAIVGHGQPVWLVYTFPRYLEAAAPGLPEVIGKEFTVVRVFHGTLGDGDVVVVRSPPK
jgi:4-amino-4-deoxy-L-arabinose transferase-like glycosyltransferase